MEAKSYLFSFLHRSFRKITETQIQRCFAFQRIIPHADATEDELKTLFAWYNLLI